MSDGPRMLPCMGRPPLDVGTYGKVNRYRAPAGGYVARVQYRDTTGKTRRVTKSSPKSYAQAERLLKSELAKRQVSDVQGVTGQSRARVLRERWQSDLEASDKSINTKQRYSEVAALHLASAFDDLRVSEITTFRVETVLSALVATGKRATARTARSILVQWLDIAVRNDAVPLNSARATTPIKNAKSSPLAANPEDIQRVRAAFATDPKAQRADLLSVFDVMLGTGARIGEVLALRWSDVDLDSETPTVTIAGTVVREPGTGVQIQGHPKTERSRRRIALPDHVSAMLSARLASAGPDGIDVVFPSSAGTVRDPISFRRQWKAALERLELPALMPHDLRKTVATSVARLLSDRDAADLLGHTAVGMTHRHYIERTPDAPDVRHVLDDYFASTTVESTR